MEKATLNAAATKATSTQHARAREDFAHSAENRRRGIELELTHAEREGGGELWQKRARLAVPSVDAHSDLYAAAVAIQAAVMAKAARALIALHEDLHNDVCQDAGNDYGEWHPVSFGGDGLGNGQRLDAVVALGVRIAADAVEALRRSLTKYQHHHGGCQGKSPMWFQVSSGGGAPAKLARAAFLRPGTAAKTPLTVALAIVLAGWRIM